ncbi:isocitrate lyase/phosphoenolpyruvate mutase family protein, partial [Streptomyces sp. NPDC051639]
LTDPARISALVESLDVPLNILYSPSGPSVAHCARRSDLHSCGSYVFLRPSAAAKYVAVIVLV